MDFLMLRTTGVFMYPRLLKITFLRNNKTLNEKVWINL